MKKRILILATLILAGFSFPAFAMEKLKPKIDNKNKIQKNNKNLEKNKKQSKNNKSSKEEISYDDLCNLIDNYKGYDEKKEKNKNSLLKNLENLNNSQNNIMDSNPAPSLEPIIKYDSAPSIFEIKEKEKRCFEEITTELDNLKEDYNRTKEMLKEFVEKINNYKNLPKSKKNNNLKKMLKKECSKIKSFNEEINEKTNDIFKEKIKTPLNNFQKNKNYEYVNIILEKSENYALTYAANATKIENLEEGIKLLKK